MYWVAVADGRIRFPVGQRVTATFWNRGSINEAIAAGDFAAIPLLHGGARRLWILYRSCPGPFNQKTGRRYRVRRED